MPRHNEPYVGSMKAFLWFTFGLLIGLWLAALLLL